MPCKNEYDHTLKYIDKWTAPSCMPTPMALSPAASYIEWEPLGLTLIMSSWNYPLMGILQPLAQAIAAGNSVIMKPSELSPETAKMIQEIFDEIRDPRYVVIQGDHLTAIELTKQDHLDLIIFTGSTEKGKLVAEAAAKNLVPCILELGGKSPIVIDEGCDLDWAANRTVFGRFLNSGQTCIAPDYVLVHENLHQKFIELVRKHIAESGMFNLEHPNGDMARMVNEFHTK